MATFAIFNQNKENLNVPKVKPKKNVPWVEKYRPAKVEDISYQTEVVNALSGCLKGNDLPHMLFYGPPGTGKTTAAVAVCKQLFTTAETFTDRVLELNASDERGIAVVRNRIKEFAQRNVRSTASKKCAATVKVIILDEADAMTTTAQMALRRIMESECRTTRFFIICNYVSRIIAPLASRCVKFRFKPLPSEAQIGRLQHIVEQENLDISTDALQQLITYSDGDLRKSITQLQSLSGFTSINNDNVAEICGHIPQTDLNMFWNQCKTQYTKNVNDACANIIHSGYNPNQFFEQLSPVIINDDTLTVLKKAELLERIGEANERIVDGASSKIVISSLAYAIHTALNN